MTPEYQALYDSIYLPDGTIAVGEDGPTGHNWKGGIIVQGKYRRVFMPQHPKSDARGYVREHILVAERALGEFLKEGEVVHHWNEDTLDNRPENLMVCESEAVHQILHRRMRAFNECGNPDYLRCPYCKQYDAPEHLVIRIYGERNHIASKHRHCHTAYEQARRNRNQTNIWHHN